MHKTFIAMLWAAALLPGISGARAQAPGAVFKDCADCPDMVVIPAGKFLMGSKADPNSPAPPPPEEQPQHPVTLKSFALGRYEVTQAQWAALMGKVPSFFKGPTLPVDAVSWADIQDFLKKLNAKTGKTYRLPTEAEWEYAARAGDAEENSFFKDYGRLDREAWYAENANRTTHPVGTKAANKFGLYDMQGNVFEWVEDCFQSNYVSAPTDGSAAKEVNGCPRVFRGGGWNATPDYVRPALRLREFATLRSYNLGFRLARSLP